jgi:hypothetical protein
MSHSHPNTLLRLVSILGVTFLTAALCGCTSSQFKPIERFSATSVSPSATSGPLATDVIVYRYAEPEELEELSLVLRNEGSKALIRALGKNEMGRLTTTAHGVGLALRLIYQVATPDGRRVVALTERPLSMLEIWNSTQSRDYEFAYLELDLDASGSGEGTLVRAGQIDSIGPRTLLVKNYDAQPIRLLAVRKR